MQKAEIINLIAPKQITITFDDFPLRQKDISMAQIKYNTEKLFEILQSEKLTVTSFVNEKYFYSFGEPDIFIKLLEKGLNIGMEPANHTFSHQSLHKVSIDSFREDILNGGKIILPLLQKAGKTTFYFRFPYLRTGNSLEVKNKISAFLKENNYVNAPVSIETFDFLFAETYYRAKVNNQDVLLKKTGELYLFYCNKLFEFYEGLSQNLFGRQIKQILMLHYNDLNIDYFTDICDILKKRGYSFSSLEEAMLDTVYKLKDNYTGDDGLTWLHRSNFNLKGYDKFHNDYYENKQISASIKSELAAMQQ
jgi:peptidoglycan/xylan/chitin deacetylase (PgdA/CDA1 family)